MLQIKGARMKIQDYELTCFFCPWGTDICSFRKEFLYFYFVLGSTSSSTIKPLIREKMRPWAQNGKHRGRTRRPSACLCMLPKYMIFSVIVFIKAQKDNFLYKIGQLFSNLNSFNMSLNSRIISPPQPPSSQNIKHYRKWRSNNTNIKMNCYQKTCFVLNHIL